MRKGLLIAELALVLLVLAPQALSFDCTRVGEYKSECEEIINLNSSDTDLLVVNLAYDSGYKPGHDFVYDWNKALSFDAAPDGVQTVNKKYIKNAWMKILAVMPSVLYNNTLLVTKESKALVGYSHKTVLPEDYESAGYPETKNGDCKTIYKLAGESVDNKVETKESVINSKYTLSVNIQIEHFTWYTYCAKAGKGGCKRYAHTCKYSKTDSASESAEITDSINVKFYDSKAEASIEPVNKYDGKVKAKVNFSNSAVFGFENAVFSFSEYYYDVVPSYKPYYILTIRAKKVNDEKIVNLHKANDHVVVSDPASCTIDYWNHFSESQEECSMDFEAVNLKLDTDKLEYKEGEKILVKITPDVPVVLTYGESTVNANGNAEFTAVKGFNKIKAVYAEISSEKIIHVAGKSVFRLLFNLSIFTSVSAFVFTVVKRSWKL